MAKDVLTYWMGVASAEHARAGREHVAALPDFAEFDTLDRAFAHALTHTDCTKALKFFLAWLRRDLAAQLIVSSPAGWDGKQYYTLPPIAESLKPCTEAWAVPTCSVCRTVAAARTGGNVITFRPLFSSDRHWPNPKR